MKHLIPVLAAAFLAACATAPAGPTASAPAPSEPNAVQSTRVAQLLASAGRADAPSRNEIERALGAPDIARSDGAGQALTYRLDSCALLLLFTADGRNEMRLAEAHPSARRDGAAAPSLDQCAAEASARR